MKGHQVSESKTLVESLLRSRAVRYGSWDSGPPPTLCQPNRNPTDSRLRNSERVKGQNRIGALVRKTPLQRLGFIRTVFSNFLPHPLHQSLHLGRCSAPL